MSVTMFAKFSWATIEPSTAMTNTWSRNIGT